VDDINQLVNYLVEQKVKAIFVESSVSVAIFKRSWSAERKGWKVVQGGELFSDAMGKPGTYEGTYVGMMDHNATTIARGLGGEAPQEGFQGKLATIARDKAQR
jgi:manganese/zinc/iron transport system substrate-binding protein